MDKREIFEKLKGKYDELVEQYELLADEGKNFEGDADFDVYSSLTDDVVKKEMYPEQYEMYQKISELESKINAFDNELKNAAKQLFEELNEKISTFENKIETNKNHIQKLEQEIEAKKQELAELKESEAYKNGDEETLLKVEDLEAEISSKISRKEQLEQRIGDYEKELEEIKKEKEQLIEQNPEYFEDLVEETTKEQEQIEEPNEEEVEEAQTSAAEPEDKSQVTEQEGQEEQVKNNKKRAAVIGGMGVAAGVQNQEAEKEDSQEKKEPKEEFKELFAKAKKGELEDKEFDRLVEIMKDTDNYSKYGITIGVVFNNGRKVFDKLNEALPTNKRFLKKVQETFGKETIEGINEDNVISKIAELDQENLTKEQKELYTMANKQLNVKEAYEKYLSAFFEQNKGKMPLMSVLSKAFEIQEYEQRESVKALQEAPATEEKNTSDMQKALEDAVVPPGQEQEIKSTPSIDSQEIDNR